MSGSPKVLPVFVVMLGGLTTACFDPSPPTEEPPMLDPTTRGVDSSATGESGTDTMSTGPTTGVDESTTGVSAGDSSSSGDPDSSSGTTEGAQDTIYEIQDGTLSEGEDVDVREVVVTAVSSEGFYIQEPLGGMYSGVFVFTGPMAPTVMRGDEVDVVGTIAELMNQTVIDVTAGMVGTTGAMGIEIQPELFFVSELGPRESEPWEGVLVRVQGSPLEVSAVPPNGFTIVDGIDPLNVSNRVYDVLSAPMTFPAFAITASFTAIQGPLGEGMSGYAIVPRDALDLEGYEPPFAMPEVHDFPIAGDTMMTMFGDVPWNAGDYYEGVRATILASISSVDIHIDVVSNGLSACGFQNADVIINGNTVGNFVIQQGTVAIDESYPIPMPIAGPMYTVRYETTATVESGCGAAGYSVTTSTITFNP